jgi:hypothetical protein
MNVKELRELLEGFDDNTEVLFQYNYGDHWRTQVAAPVDKVEEGKVIPSPYHNMDRVLDEDDEQEDEPSPDERNVVLIG